MGLRYGEGILGFEVILSVVRCYLESNATLWTEERRKLRSDWVDKVFFMMNEFYDGIF